MRGNPHVRFGGRPHGKGPAPRAPRRAAHPSQITKDQFGLDHTQVRSWHGWHRHTTLTMISFALTVLAIRDEQPEPDPNRHDLTNHSGPIAVTVNEARYLIAAIILATKASGRQLLNHLRHWSTWRRLHQDQARAAHYRRRLATAPC